MSRGTIRQRRYKRLIYAMLLRLSAETLLEVARNPKHIGAEIGFFSVLHTCLRP
jgi:hypothetical protein